MGTIIFLYIAWAMLIQQNTQKNFPLSLLKVPPNRQVSFLAFYLSLEGSV